MKLFIYLFNSNIKISKKNKINDIINEWINIFMHVFSADMYRLSWTVMLAVLSSAAELPESGSGHWSHQETVKDFPIPEIDGTIAKVRILVYWPARGPGLRMKEGRPLALLWCDSSLMEPVGGGGGVRSQDRAVGKLFVMT